MTSWDVKHYVYCPVIVWIRHALGVEELPDLNMELGRSKPYDGRLLERIGVPRPWRFEVALRNPSLRVAGVVDLVGGDGRYEVVEVKAFGRRSFSHFTAQLMFYAYLVSTTLGPVTRAHLVLGGRARTYAVTERALKEVERVVSRVLEIRESERPPSTPYAGSRRCLACWYRRHCPRV